MLAPPQRVTWTNCDYFGMHVRMYDMVVVGAGPAGTSAAMVAARRGLRVLLLERCKFPRDKVCGDGVTVAALAVVDRLGALEAIERLPHWKTRGHAIYSPSGQRIECRMPKVPGLRDKSIIVPRKDFDQILFERAANTPNVEARLEYNVTSVLPHADGSVTVRARHRGSEQAVVGRCVVAADGPMSVVARGLGRRNLVPKHRALAIRAYFEGVEGVSDLVDFHYDPEILPAYAWIFPLGPDRANVGLGVPAESGLGPRLRPLLESFVAKNRHARAKLAKAEMVPGSCRGWSLPLGSFGGKRGVGSVILTGDAASFVDPLTGEGIYQALRSGELAAMAVAEHFSVAWQSRDLAARYERAWRREFLLRDFWPGYLMQRLNSRPPLLDWFLRHTAKSERRTTMLSGAIGHCLPKYRLLAGW